MRYMIAIAAAAVTLMAGCAQPPAGPPADRVADTIVPTEEVQVYEQVLRRYLTSPSENSFPENTFKTVYVLDHAHPEAGESIPRQEPTVPISADAQRAIAAGLATTATVKFIADKKSVLDETNGCAQVKDGGILITLGTLKGDDREKQVGINGFVACLGATWLTYVVENRQGTGWTVKGTTGSMTIS